MTKAPKYPRVIVSKNRHIALRSEARKKKMTIAKVLEARLYDLDIRLLAQEATKK